MAHANWERRIDAIEFLESAEAEGCAHPCIMDAKETFAELVQLDVRVWVASSSDMSTVDEVFLGLPPCTAPRVVEIVGQFLADECTLDQNVLRLWWD